MKGQFEIGDKLKIAGMTLEVPCRFRAQCYTHILQRVCVQILHEIDLAKDIFEAKTLCFDIAQELIQLLDSRVMDSVNDDLCKNLKSNLKKYNGLNPVLALIRYYTDNGNKNYSKYLFNLDVNLHTHLNELADCFLRVNARLIGRIAQDYSILNNNFLQEFSLDGAKLKRIHFTGSDRHHFGQQVCILEFGNSRTADQKFIVYKPKPCTASAFLVGDMEKLRRIDPIYQNCQSLNELLNTQLEDNDRLTTYLIWPCVDIAHRNQEIGAVPIDNHYGYVEYVSHEPWSSPKVHKIISNIYLEFSQRASYTTREITIETEKRSRQEHIESLRQAALAEYSDFIITRIDDWERYSRICGIYTMAFIFAGVTDTHHGNVILYKGLPVPIDTEICMSAMPYNIQSVGCLNGDNGAMRSHTLKPTSIRVLNDIYGMHILHIKVLENNRLYRLYRKVKDTLIACNVTMEHFFKGIETTLGCMVRLESTGKLTQWILSQPLQSAYLRVIPFETAAFEQDLAFAEEHRFDHTEVSQHLNTRLKFRLQYIDTAHPEDVKNNMIYLDCNTSYLHQEYHMSSIPCFWVQANATRLITGSSTIVRFPENSVQLAEAIVKDEQPILLLQDNYYTVSPQIMVQQRLAFLCNTENHARLLKDLREEEEVRSVIRSDELAGSNEFRHDATFFTVIELSGRTPPMIKETEVGYQAGSEDSDDSDVISKTSIK